MKFELIESSVLNLSNFFLIEEDLTFKKMNDKDPAVPVFTNNKIKANFRIEKTETTTMIEMNKGIVQRKAIFSEIDRFFIFVFFVKNIDVFSDHRS